MKTYETEHGAQQMFAMSYVQIAREMGISPETVERTIRRAMKKIRRECRRRGIRFHDYVTEGE